MTNAERTRQLIEAYRQVEVPPAGVENRVLEAVRSRVASGAAPDASVDLSPAAVVVPSRTPWLAMGGVGVAVVAVIVAVLAGDASRPAPAPAVAAPALSVEPSPPPEPGREEVPQVVESLEAAVDTDVSPVAGDAADPELARRTRPRRADPVATVDVEVQLIKEARRALRDGDSSRALRRLGEHRRRFAEGVMAELREVLRVQALCELGRSEDAGRVAAEFRRRYPSSPHASRVAAGCRG